MNTDKFPTSLGCPKPASIKPKDKGLMGEGDVILTLDANKFSKSQLADMISESTKEIQSLQDDNKRLWENHAELERLREVSQRNTDQLIEYVHKIQSLQSKLEKVTKIAEEAIGLLERVAPFGTSLDITTLKLHKELKEIL